MRRKIVTHLFALSLIVLTALTTWIPAVATSLPSPTWAEQGTFLEGDVIVAVNQTRRTAHITVGRIRIYRAATYSFDNLWVTLAACEKPIPVTHPGLNFCVALMRYPLGAMAEQSEWLAFDSGEFPIDLPSSGNSDLAVLLESRKSGSFYYYDYRNLGVFTFGSTASMAKGQVKVSGTWRNPYSGQTGTLNPNYLTDEFSFFDFGDPSNPEVFVKVLGRNDPDYYQVLVGASTTFEYTLSFEGCGQKLNFFKPAMSSEGYSNGKAIAKAGCSPQPSCSNISGIWNASLANSCGGSGSSPLTIIQNGCAFSFSVPGFDLVSTGTLSQQRGEFTFTQSGACAAKGTGVLSVAGNTITGSFFGTITASGPGCCPMGPYSGSFTLTR